MEFRVSRDTVADIPDDLILFACLAVLVVALHLWLFGMELRAVGSREFSRWAVELNRDENWVVGYTRNRDLVRTRVQPGVIVHTRRAADPWLDRYMRRRAAAICTRSVIELLVYLLFWAALWLWPGTPGPSSDSNGLTGTLSDWAGFVGGGLVAWTILTSPLLLFDGNQRYPIPAIESQTFDITGFIQTQQRNTQTVSYNVISQPVLMLPAKANEALEPEFKRFAPRTTPGQRVYLTGTLLWLLAGTLWCVTGHLTCAFYRWTDARWPAPDGDTSNQDLWIARWLSKRFGLTDVDLVDTDQA